MVFDLNQQDDHHAACQVSKRYILLKDRDTTEADILEISLHLDARPSLRLIPTMREFFLLGSMKPETTGNHSRYVLNLLDTTNWLVEYPDTWVNGRTGTLVENPNKNFFIGNYDSNTTVQGLVRVTFDSTIKTYEEVRGYEILKPLQYTRCAFGIEVKACFFNV